MGAGDCVRRSGNTAVKSSCSDSGAYRVVSVADTREQCADKSQPYVLNPTKDGKTQVLCLTPSEADHYLPVTYGVVTWSA